MSTYLYPDSAPTICTHSALHAPDITHHGWNQAWRLGLQSHLALLGRMSLYEKEELSVQGQYDLLISKARCYRASAPVQHATVVVLTRLSEMQQLNPSPRIWTSSDDLSLLLSILQRHVIREHPYTLRTTPVGNMATT